jgi:hypothetical protein
MSYYLFFWSISIIPNGYVLRVYLFLLPLVLKWVCEDLNNYIMTFLGYLVVVV